MPDETLIVASSRPYARYQDAVVVPTPLQAIQRLEMHRVGTVILSGSFARNRELATFLRDAYPGVRVEREV
jgi:hypothetical protein